MTGITSWSARLQASKHKLTDKELGENVNSGSSEHEKPLDNKERDQSLQDIQQSEPFDFSDPDG